MSIISNPIEPATDKIFSIEKFYDCFDNSYQHIIADDLTNKSEAEACIDLCRFAIGVLAGEGNFHLIQRVYDYYSRRREKICKVMGAKSMEAISVYIYCQERDDENKAKRKLIEKFGNTILVEKEEIVPIETTSATEYYSTNLACLSRCKKAALFQGLNDCKGFFKRHYSHQNRGNYGR